MAGFERRGVLRKVSSGLVLEVGFLPDSLHMAPFEFAAMEDVSSHTTERLAVVGSWDAVRAAERHQEDDVKNHLVVASRIFSRRQVVVPPWRRA